MIEFIKTYWTQIIFFLGVVGTLVKMMYDNNEAVKCSLRNDMLEIWDKCKDTETISKYQLESFMASRDLYYKKNGDGFIHVIDNKIQQFKIVD